MMKVNPFLKEEDDGSGSNNSDMEHYNQNSQVIEKCSSSSSSKGVEERKGSNGDGEQTPTLHGSQCPHQEEEGSPEMVPLNGLNESGHEPIAFLVNSVESFKHPASQISEALSPPP